MTPNITFNNFWLPLGVILFTAWFAYLCIWVMIETIKKNKKEKN